MPNFNLYNINNTVRVAAQFLDLDGSPTDPENVTLILRLPDGQVITKVFEDGSDIVKESVGHYYCDVLITVSGRWFYGWKGTGEVEVFSEYHFYVARSKLI